MFFYIVIIIFAFPILYFYIFGFVAFYSIFDPIHKKDKAYKGFIITGLSLEIIGVITSYIIIDSIINNVKSNNVLFLVGLLIIFGLFLPFLIRRIFGDNTKLDASKFNPKLDILTDSGVNSAIRGDHDEAMNIFNKALEINPNDINTLSQKANLLNRLHRDEEAILICDKVLEIEQDYEHALHYKAIALTNLRRHQEAMEYYDRVLKINPKNAEAKKNKGRCHYGIYEKLGLLNEMPEYTWEQISHRSAEDLIKEVNTILAKKIVR